MLPGTVEFQAHIRYFEAGKMRRLETPVWSHSFVGATQAAEKIVLSGHPSAAIMSMELIHTDRKKMSVPRLAFVNNEEPRPHPKSPAKKKSRWVSFFLLTEPKSFCRLIDTERTHQGVAQRQSTGFGHRGPRFRNSPP